MDNKQNVSREEIENWLKEKLMEDTNLSKEDFEKDASFADLGIDSLKAVTITSDLEDWLDLTLIPNLFWEYPTIEKISELLMEELAQKISG